MTRDEAIKELNSISISSDFNFNRVVAIIMENAALRVQYKEEILTRREEEVLIEYLYSMGAEDRYVEDRVAASAFFYHYRTLQRAVEDLHYIYTYIIKASLFFKTVFIFQKTGNFKNEVLKQLPEISERELDNYREEILELYGQTRETVQGIKVKVKELEQILKHYFTEIQEYKEMIKEEKQRAQKLTRDIIKLSKELKKKYSVYTYDPPNHLRSYNQETIEGLKTTSKISELINP